MKSILKRIGAMPWITLIAVLAFPLALNALEVLANPATQIRNFQIKWIAGFAESLVQIKGDSVFLKIPDSLAQPDDDVCRRAAQVFHDICSLDPSIVLYVSRLTPKIVWNGSGDRDSGENFIDYNWIPSARNPMTAEWTRQLVDYDEHER
jgi:hypothetical protein